MVPINRRGFVLFILLFCLFVGCCKSAPVPEKSEIPDTSTAAPLEDEDDPGRLKRYAELGLKPTPVQKTQPFSSLHPDARGYIPAYHLPGAAGESSAGTSSLSSGSGLTELAGRTSTHKPTEQEPPSEAPRDSAPGQGGAIGGYTTAPPAQIQGTTTAAIRQGSAEGTVQAQATSDQTSSTTTLAAILPGAPGSAPAAQADMVVPSGTGHAGGADTGGEASHKTTPALSESGSKMVGVDSNPPHSSPGQPSSNAVDARTQATPSTHLSSNTAWLTDGSDGGLVRASASTMSGPSGAGSTPPGAPVVALESARSSVTTTTGSMQPAGVSGSGKTQVVGAIGSGGALVAPVTNQAPAPGAGVGVVDAAPATTTA